MVLDGAQDHFSNFGVDERHVCAPLGSKSLYRGPICGPADDFLDCDITENFLIVMSRFDSERALPMSSIFEGKWTMLIKTYIIVIPVSDVPCIAEHNAALP